MANVEILKEFIDEEGQLTTAPLFEYANYPETPPPAFLINSENGLMHFKLRQNGSPYSFDIYRADNSTSDTSNNVQKVDNVLFEHIGMVDQTGRVFLVETTIKGVETAIFAKVTPESLP